MSLRMNTAPSSPPRSPQRSRKRKALSRCSSPLRQRVKVESPPQRREHLEPRKKFIHVHHYKQTQLYGAWFNDPTITGKKKRLFFGSHQTAYLAARAQDRAALKYKPSALDPSAIVLNFKEADYVADEELREKLTNAEFGELLRKESRPFYTKMEPTPCLWQFLNEERARGNIPIDSRMKVNVISLQKYLEKVIQNRNSNREAKVKEEPIYRSFEDKKGQVTIEAPRAKPMKHESSLAALPDQPCLVPERRRSRSPRSSDRGFHLQWGATRPRSNVRFVTNFKRDFLIDIIAQNKLEYKLQKMESSTKTPEPVSETTVPAGLVDVGRNKLQNKLQKMQNAKTLEPSPPTATEPVPAGLDMFRHKLQYKPHRIVRKMENDAKTPEPSFATAIEPVPAGIDMFRSKLHYKMHKIANKTPQPASETGTESVPAGARESPSTTTTGVPELDLLALVIADMCRTI